ncbi:cytochrome c [Corallococcus sp. bb12-1]|uniref:Cytochrome c n=1 Tax=Corallococcus terminator TaxID=2316733 RepID=A0A3A8JEF3_9BACT|nr:MULTISPECIES: cytochrome c [Corallococcus]MCY1044368.1 cytochrome c [Corallococcus sp. bb12-1]RKG90240.1 cytochrome c [Corallococcus terminator]
MTTRLCLLVSTLLLCAPVARAEDAAELWGKSCKSCHGPDGRAQTRLGQKEAIVDMSQAAWQKAETDAELRAVIANGSSRNTKMKAYKDRLTPEQMDALVRYIRTFKAK